MTLRWSIPAAVWTLASVCVTALSGAEIPKGTVLARVACTGNESQTYALYIPTAFDPGRKWPVLFCFDPGARGQAPVERFKSAAEKFGWIVAGSNNSRNGPWEANAAAINAMVNDVNRHLPIDSKRIYATGLSGGARVACQFGMSGVVQGVIACSAAFAGSETPSRLPYAFFGTAGETDFNYRELRRVDRELANVRGAHRVVIFKGGHEWLPVDLAIEALAWMELQAMRNGVRAKDATWIEEQLASRMAAVPPTPPVDRHRALQAIAVDFKGLAGTAAIEQEAASLGATKAVRDALKAERAAEKNEQAQVESLLTAASEGFAAPERKRIEELQRKAKTDGPDHAMATRVLQGVASSCGEMAREALRAQEYESAASLLEMATLLRPERAQAHFDLARARGFQGDRKRALAALQQAVQAGFRDAARIADEKAFAKLRDDPAFVALLASVR